MDRNRNSTRENPAGKGDERKFTTNMQKKLVILYILVLLAFAGLSFRLFVINRDSGEQYKRQVLVQQQQQYTNTTIPFKRGEILDSKGTKLAVSEKVYNLILDCKLMNRKPEYVDATIAALGQYFDVDESKIRKYAEENPTSQYYSLAKQLTYDQIAPFQEAQNDKETGANIQGVWFEENYKRNYPNGTLACDVVGFTTSDNEGKYGLEEYYNDVLSGVNGRQYGYINDDGILEGTTKSAVDGYNLVSTIDANIQTIVERNLRQFNETYKNAVREGNAARNVGCVMMDIHNGDVLAMASYPFFDLNDPRNSDYLIGSNLIELEGNQEKIRETALNAENIAALDDEELYRQLNGLWKNFCISSTYEPGSTMKSFTAAAALESGKISVDQTFLCEGSLTVVEGQKPIHCHNRLGDGILTIEQAIERSCNVAMMRMGFDMGKETFLSYMEDFNFGLKTNVDLAGETRTAALVFNESTMGPVELATATFGQGFNVTMIQMITGFSSLINGGYYYEPHLVKKITASDGSVVQSKEPRVLKQVISESTSEKIRQYCVEVVTGENGTGSTARPPGYIIGGKTGTAETVPRGNKQYVVSFMGFAPADDPQIAIYVVVDRPNAIPQDNARFATTLVRSILMEALPYLNIFMTEPLSEKEEQELKDLQINIKQDLMSQVSGNDVSGNSVSGNDVPDGQGAEGGEAGQTGGDAEGGAESGGEEAPKKEVKIDPETGYAITDDGTLVDPVTGIPIDPDISDLPE